MPPVAFKYAKIEINGKSVLVTQTAFSDATDEFQKQINAIKDTAGITPDMLTKGFALQTPPAMNPLTLGSVEDFSNWVNTEMKSDSDFSLATSIAQLPSPFSTGLGTLLSTDVVIYSAALFYNPAPAKKLYGELVIGFKIPKDKFTGDFPLTLKEIVIAVNNYPAPPKQNTN
jgi:hypothetical protein